MYKPRHLSSKELININDWRVKSYTISESSIFQSTEAYQLTLINLPSWLQDLNSFNPNHNFIAFLIVHEGNEGVFTLLNTWVGNNMLQTHVYFCNHDDQSNFRKISGDGLFACVWELEIMMHEKKLWVDHILKQPNSPDYNNYLSETLNKKV